MFAKRLRETRLAKELTQKELGRLVGLTKAGISAYETGIRMPPPQILSELASVLGVSTDYLLGLTDYPRVVSEEAAHVLASKNAREYLDRVADDTRYNIYQTDLPPGLTADSPPEDWAAVLTEAIARSGIDLTETDRRQIAEAAAAVVSTLARQKSAEAAEKQIRRHGQENGSAPEK